MWSVPYDLSIDTARADALFASVLQISDEPTAVQVKRAIDAGQTKCARGCITEVGWLSGHAEERLRATQALASRPAAGAAGRAAGDVRAPR